ncbi:MAG: sigma-54-dependent transcriptional regulator [Candidatus Krumholzibacteriia bacterium]
MAVIFVVDDEEKITRLLQSQLADAGHTALGMTRPAEALERIAEHPPDIVITDLRMDEIDGITLLKKVKETSPATDVVVMTAYATVETALDTMKQGAYDYIIKPFTTDELLMLIERIEQKRRLESENSELRSYLAAGMEDEIVGEGAAILAVKKAIGDLAASEAPVLIRGESGTGKELVARAIHKTSARAGGPFIAINCAAIPDNLLESELFGYEKGAFTGAVGRKLGHFQMADGGTLFLDEIGDLPALLQSKLLRVLEDHRITPLGSSKETEVDLRILSATNRPLEADIREGRFREDLYYRINVFPIELPALRDRLEDVRDIARHFLSRAGRNPDDLAESAVHKLLSYDWPGNIRELRNVLERALIVRASGEIGEDAILLLQTTAAPAPGAPGEGLSLEAMEKRLVAKALKITAGNKSEAARLLGITRRALYGRLERYGME